MVAVLAAATSIIWWNLRPLGPVRTSYVVGQSLLNGGGLERVVIQYAPGQPLTVEQKRALGKIVYPVFAGWTASEVRTGKMSNKLGYTVLILRKGNDERRLRLSATEGPNGATLSPTQILIRAWNFPMMKPGQWELPAVEDVDSQLAGIRRDRAALERAGLTKLNAWSGEPITFDEYIRELEERKAQALRPPAPSGPAR